jgi:predicted negative regulator of RcsB-dependent stress response
MSKKITQKQLKHDEFVEAAFDFGLWMEEHWASVLKWVGAGVVIVLLVVAWSAWSKKGLADAKSRLALGIDQYKASEATGFSDVDSLNAALKRFDEVAKDLGSRPPGQLVQFYRGATLFQLDRLDEAKTTLTGVVEQTEASETVGATARVMLARVEAAAGRPDEAVALLQALVESADPAVPPARVLLEIGRIHEAAGRHDEARKQWERVVSEYPQSVAMSEARTLLQ